MSRILIIDDDPDIVEAMRVVLESKNYEVLSAKNGEEGLKKVKINKPDLIILDIMMDTADEGFEVARVLKQASDYKNTPILMLTAIKERTGFDFKDESGDEAWLPVDDYAEKPLKPEELISKVENLLRKRGKE
ncbi:MAG: response regulator [Candidatus Omnitrophota bacterium]|nr:response regulator [Candidatus Omnitrophota bacterium]